MTNNALIPLDQLQQLDTMALTDTKLVAIAEKILETTLALFETLPDIETLLENKHQAQALGDYVTRHIRSRDAKQEAENHIADARIRIERQLGILLQRMQDNGELAKQGKPTTHEGLQPLKLEDIGVTYHQSSTWKALANFPPEKFEQHIATAKENGSKLTTIGVVNHAINTLKQGFKPLGHFAKCSVVLDGERLVLCVPPETLFAVRQALLNEVKGFGVSLFEEKHHD